jgi:cation diffusion facilitator CzcD-associated flavoprotein CzcO
MEDGEKLQAKSVVLALGIGPFYHRPEQFDGIPRELAPHSSDLSDFSVFKGKRVAVIGKGQSALEYAALLHENQAQAQIITRAAGLTYRPFAWRKNLFRTLTPGLLRGFSYRVFPPTDLGDIRTARKMANPDLFRKQTPEVQEKLLKDCAKPVGAYWLPSRLEKCP